MSLPTESWYEKAPKGSPDNYVTTHNVTYTFVQPPKWIYKIIAGRPTFVCLNFKLGVLPTAVQPTIEMLIFKKNYFDVSVIGGNEETLPGALPHDKGYESADSLAKYYGVDVRTILHMFDHLFFMTLNMTGWKFKRTYFTAVRMFGYPFNRLGKWFRS